MKDWSLLQLFLYTLMIIELNAIAVIDIKYKTINSTILCAMFLGGLISVLTGGREGILNAIAAMLAVFAGLGAVYYITRKSIGLGDIKLCTCISLYLGLEGVFTMLVISMLMCGLVGIVLITINKSNKDKAIPYAPFAALGTIAVLLL